MSEETPSLIGPKERQKQWLRRLADEYIKLESKLPASTNFLPEEENCPKWVANLEREVGATMFPVAKLKEELKLTPRRLGAILGHPASPRRATVILTRPRPF
jgi:hypothetical protein